MATPTWALVATLLADKIDATGNASIDMNDQSQRMRQYVRRKVINRWYRRHWGEPADLVSETKGGVVGWTVKPHEAI